MLIFTLSPETLENLFLPASKEYRLQIASGGFQADHLSPGYQLTLSSKDQAEDLQGMLWLLLPLSKK